jgi:hypothetical protein
LKIEQVKQELNESNVASDLLNYCLADNQWLAEVFERFKKLLIDIDDYITNNIETTVDTVTNSIIGDQISEVSNSNNNEIILPSPPESTMDINTMKNQ